MNPKLAEKAENLAALKRLGTNEDFQTIFLPHLIERAEHHAAQCRNRDLTPEKRAEHIEAADLAESLLDYLDARKKTLEAKIREKKQGH